MRNIQEFIKEKAESIVNLHVNAEFVSDIPALNPFEIQSMDGNEESGSVTLMSVFPYYLGNECNDVTSVYESYNIKFSYSEKFEMKLKAVVNYFQIENGYNFNLDSMDYDIKFEAIEDVMMYEEAIEFLHSKGVDYVDFAIKYANELGSDPKEFIDMTVSPNPREAISDFSENVYFPEE